MTAVIPSTTTPTEVTMTESTGRRLWSSFIARQETSLLIVIVAIGAFAGTKSSLFLAADNLTEILRSSVIYFLMGCGAALLVIGGGLDFSAGAAFTLGGLTAAKLMVAGSPWPIAVLVGVAACAVVGVVNHVIITYLHVPPIIATLGTFFMLGGFDNLYTGGDDVLPLPNSFQTLGQGNTVGIPNIILIAIVVGLFFWGLLEHSRFGINVRALGGNREAAVRNGLRTVRLDLALYAIAGTTAGLAGIMYASRVGAGQVAAGGTSTTLNVITAVLIGGVSLQGGLGSVQGVAIGAVLLSLINNALVLTQIPPDYNSIVVGAILVGAVGIDHLRRERLYRKR